MTPSQLRLWFLQRFDPDDGAFNLRGVRRLTGELDVDRMRWALTQVVARHEPLRTRFPEIDGQPVAVIEPPGPVEMEWIDLTAMAPDEAEREAARLVDERINAPFDLLAAPPLRTALIRLTERTHILVVVAHHIIVDGWSLEILLSDIAEFYSGNPPAPLAMSYSEYEKARAEKYGPDAERRDLEYWVKQLANPPVLELPADRPRPAERRGLGAEIPIRIDEELTRALEEVARRERCTLFMLLLAAYQVLLARHSGQDDICVGTPIAGRDNKTMGMVANLSGVLVMRADLSDDPDFRTLLLRTRSTLLKGMAHSAVPFERLINELGVARDLSVTPLYQAVLTLHPEVANPELPFGDITAELVVPTWRWARHDLVLDLWRSRNEGLIGTAEYSTELFDRETVETFFERFTVLLRGIVANPGTRISRLPLMGQAERDRLVLQWNATERPLPQPATLVNLFRAQVAKSPDATAVVCGADSLTYREVDEISDRIAARLRAEGAGRGTVVAVCVNRSVGMLAVLLGVLKAGAAYTPIDPEYPAARIAYVVEDSGALLAFADEDLRDRLPAGMRVLTPADCPSSGEPLPGGEPHDPAYMLYTSGSTGRPKGVVIQNSALVNLLVGMGDLLTPGPGDVWLMLTSLSFDISALELYLPVINGGQTVIVDRATAIDGAAQLALIEKTGVTHIQATPAGWRVLIDAGFSNTGITGLVGGEALPDELARELRPRVGRLINVYGPTETTIWSTTWEVPLPPEQPRIGRPIANTRVYVLDAHGQVVPTGVTGELAIGGAGVAIGYHGRPALTADRFIPDPFGPPGSRLYRTGDRVRQRADGQLEFLGRFDNQVKVRGFRVEPGEIEAAILACEGVRQAAVIARGESLLAYIVGTADIGELRAELEQTLPLHMMPAAWTRLPALPLTVSGKVDRKALPDPTPEHTAESVEPRTDAERLVADIWSEVLELDRVSVTDNFFAIGGHSLSAIRVAARLRATIGVKVPMRTLFTRRTLAELAQAVEELLKPS